MSSNRKTNIKVIIDGKEINKLLNVTINYKQTFVELKKSLESHTRTAPDSKYYAFDEVHIKIGDKFEDLTEENLSAVQNSLFEAAQLNPSFTSNRVHIEVFLKCTVIPQMIILLTCF